MKTPWSFVRRTRPTGFHSFLRSTSSRYCFRPAVRRGSDPRRRRAPPSPHLREGQPESLQRGLPAVVREHEAGLEAAERELVAVEVLDQHRDPRQPPRSHRGEAEQRRLPPGGHAQERVRRLRLVAVLGQPDRLRPEGAPDEDEGFLIVAIVIEGQSRQPPLDGVSDGVKGYGWWAYASNFARARAMPRTQATGATPPAAPRGPVTPPPTWACGSTAWIPSYAGLSTCRT